MIAVFGTHVWNDNVSSNFFCFLKILIFWYRYGTLMQVISTLALFLFIDWFLFAVSIFFCLLAECSAFPFWKIVPYDIFSDFTKLAKSTLLSQITAARWMLVIEAVLICSSPVITWNLSQSSIVFRSRN